MNRRETSEKFRKITKISLEKFENCNEILPKHSKQNWTKYDKGYTDYKFKQHKTNKILIHTVPNTRLKQNKLNK